MNCDFIHVQGDHLYVAVDLRVYPMTIVRSVAHRFTGRCAMHLEIEDDATIAVRFHLKVEGENPRSLAEEFMNALLDQTVRAQVAQETEAVRNLILAHALSDTPLLHPELETIDPAEDPLGISTPDSYDTSH